MEYLLDDNGDKIILFHGTNRKFTEHKMEKNRSVLNNNYQGDWVCYTKDFSVAWKYSSAKRNNQMDKVDFLNETKEVFSKISPEVADFMVDFSEKMMKGGWDTGWDDAVAKFIIDSNVNKETAHFEFSQKIREHESKLNFDINDFCDCLESVEYSNMGSSNSLDDVMSLFSDNTSGGGLGFHDAEMLKGMGYDKILPEERVLESYVKANKVLKTKSRAAAKKARENGYDLVIYSGEDCVDNQPEYLISDPSQIELIAINKRVAYEEEEDDSCYTITSYKVEREKITKVKEPKKRIRSQNRMR